MLQKYDDLDDDALLEAIARRDKVAFQALMVRHASALLIAAEQMLENPSDADDVVQEVFVKLWEKPLKWQASGPATFRTWLHRVVRNACIDRLRCRKTLPLDHATEICDPKALSTHSVLAMQRQILVNDAIGELPERQRNAIDLRYRRDLSCEKAAQRIGVSMAALDALLVRGRRSIRDSLSRRGLGTLQDLLE